MADKFTKKAQTSLVNLFFCAKIFMLEILLDNGHITKVLPSMYYRRQTCYVIFRHSIIIKYFFKITVDKIKIATIVQHVAPKVSSEKNYLHIILSYCILSQPA